MSKRGPFKHFKTSPEIIRLAVMMYVRFPLSLRNVEDLLHEWRIDYDLRRPHSALGGLTPTEFADQLNPARKFA